MVGKRIVSRFLDEVIGVSFAIVGLVVTAIPAALLYLLATFLDVETISTVVGLVLGVPVAATFIFIYVWAVAERASNNGQSVGMSITKTRYISNKERLSNPFLKFMYRWIWIGQKESGSWAGSEQDDISSLMLFRKYFTPFVLFSVSLVVLATLVVVRIPVFFFNLVGGDIDLFASIPIVDYPIALLAIVITLLTVAGPLLIFTKQRKTLSDHFFGVQMVEAPIAEETGSRANIWQWFWNK